MTDYIGISENRIHHMLGVARECYTIAKLKGYDETFCRRMFIIGWNHDIGYEFSEKQEDHPDVSADMIESLGGKDFLKDEEGLIARDAVRKHGKYVDIKTPEWYILNAADMTIDNKGNKVDVMKRLSDIKNRYGEYSDQYNTACDIACQIGLTAINMSIFVD